MTRVMSTRILLGGVCMLGLAWGAFAEEKCPANAVWEDCGTACPGVCGKPTSTMCTEQCVIGCQCVAGFQRRSDKGLAQGIPSTAGDTFCVADSLCQASVPPGLDQECPTCATTRCRGDSKCAQEEVQCVRAPCCPLVRCVEKPSPTPVIATECVKCEAVRCAVPGTVCKLLPTSCPPPSSDAPAPKCCPLAECVANTPVPKQDTFNCYTLEMWSQEKQEWCCNNKQLGCLVVDPPHPVDPLPAVSCQDLLSRSTFALGVYIPQCDQKSPHLYQRKQCWENECWCVDQNTNHKTGPLSADGSCTMVDSDASGSTHGKALRIGDVCRSGGVETGRFVDRSTDCPRGTVCKPKRGQFAIGGEVDQICQRLPKKHRTVSLVAKKGISREDAIKKAKEFAESLLKSLKAKSGGESIIEVLVKFVCEIPSVRAALGITDEDRKSTRCTAVDGASAEESVGAHRNLRTLGLNDMSVLLDTTVKTDATEAKGWVADTIADIADDSTNPVSQVIAIESEQIKQTAVSLAVGWEGSADGSEEDKKGGNGYLGAILAGLAAVLGVSGCSVLALQKYSRNKAEPVPEMPLSTGSASGASFKAVVDDEVDKHQMESV
eukprot:Hpha_TRINITY_DN15241_c2_g22::TRINITY_DN15241_c2_g22_i1::g.66329::m.66329